MSTPAAERASPIRHWVVSWLAYATYYLGRKGFSAAKHSLKSAGLVSESALGAIDAVYLAAYALGQFTSGFLGDAIGARRLVGYGLLLSALACMAFGSASGALLFGVLFTINGLAQATGWPGTTLAMAEWTTPSNRGTVMGWWSTCYQVGGLVAGPFAGMLIVRYGWRAAYTVPALIMAAVGVLVLLVLRPGPRASAEGLEAPLAAAAARRQAQREVLTNRSLWCYGASYFFIKFMRYALLFWLPYFLSVTLGYAADEATWVSSAFEAGGILGVIGIGRLSDRVRHGRVALSLISLLLLAGALLAYASFGGASTALNVLLFALVGVFLFAPDSILCGAAAQDAGGRHAAATATGFVNGVGSIGGFIEGLTVPALAAHYGWNALFPCLVAMALLAAACLLPALRSSARISSRARGP